MAIGLIAAGCSDDTASPEPVESAVPAVTSTTEAAPDPTLSPERDAAIAAWTSRPLEQILGEGFDLTRCVGEPSTDDEITGDATVHGRGWAFLPLHSRSWSGTG